MGRLVTRLTNDIQNMHEMFTSVIVTVFNDFVRIFGIAILLFYMNWKLALVMLLLLPVILGNTVWFSKLARHAFRDIRLQVARINSFLQETLTGMAIVQLFGRQQAAAAKFDEINREYYRRSMHQITIFGIFMPFIEVLGTVAVALIIWYGGGRVSEAPSDPWRTGRLSGLYAPLFSADPGALPEIFHRPVGHGLGGKDLRPARHQAGASGKQKRPHPRQADGQHRIQGRPLFLQKGPAGTAGPLLRRPARGNLCRGGRHRFRQDHHHQSAGTLLRSRRPAPFYLDGVDLKELDTAWLRNQIGLVMQDVFIIPATLAENIFLNQPVDEARLAEILKNAQLSELVEQLPDKAKTVVGEGGYQLSAGQKQLLSFARVLARDPKILVLDEATSNIDSGTELLVEKAIAHTLNNRTSVVIAHRLSTIRRADRIMVMERGRIVQLGTHDELMQKEGPYRTMQLVQNGFVDNEPQNDRTAEYEPRKLNAEQK